jgi:hypothetical protein
MKNSQLCILTNLNILKNVKGYLKNILWLMWNYVNKFILYII